MSEVPPRWVVAAGDETFSSGTSQGKPACRRRGTGLPRS